MMRETSRNRSVLSAGVVLAALLLGGCTAAQEPAPAIEDGTAESAEAESSAAESTPTAISCAEIAPLAASITGGMELSAADSSEDPSATTCVWVTGDVAEATTDLGGYGSIAIGVDGTGWTAEDMDTLSATGTVIDDPRAAAVDGRVYLLAEGVTLGEAGSVQLLFPEGTVTVVATGAALTATADETAVPVDDVIGVAAEVAALRR